MWNRQGFLRVRMWCEAEEFDPINVQRTYMINVTPGVRCNSDRVCINNFRYADDIALIRFGFNHSDIILCYVFMINITCVKRACWSWLVVARDRGFHDTVERLDVMMPFKYILRNIEACSTIVLLMWDRFCIVRGQMVNNKIIFQTSNT